MSTESKSRMRNFCSPLVALNQSMSWKKRTRVNRNSAQSICESLRSGLKLHSNKELPYIGWILDGD
jgi:hypothetical protein